MTNNEQQNVTVWVEVSPEQAAASAARYWWVVLVGGLLSLAFEQAWMVFEPVHAAPTPYAVLLGLWLVVVGIVDLVSAGSARHRTPAIVAGVVFIVLGLVLIFKPGIPVKVIAIVWGLAILLGGIVPRGRRAGRPVLRLGLAGCAGAISATLAFVIVVWPTATVRGRVHRVRDHCNAHRSGLDRAASSPSGKRRNCSSHRRAGAHPRANSRNTPARPPAGRCAHPARSRPDR